jgi:hypothetical protein
MINKNIEVVKVELELSEIEELENKIAPDSGSVPLI